MGKKRNRSEESRRAALERRARAEAEQGDLRPQFNRHSLTSWVELPQDIEELKPILRDRFFQLSRPIADASLGVRADGRLSDAGRFFYLVETLRRLAFPNLEETLLMILDEFQCLEPSAYNELYLWSIVELSRVDSRHVHAFWPMVLDLDERYRHRDWQRPPGAAIADQPYRLCELLFYYFAQYTSHLHEAALHPEHGQRRFASLAKCLSQLWPSLPTGQRTLVLTTLGDLHRQLGKVLYDDARAYLKNLRS